MIYVGKLKRIFQILVIYPNIQSHIFFLLLCRSLCWAALILKFTLPTFGGICHRLFYFLFLGFLNYFSIHLLPNWKVMENVFSTDLAFYNFYFIFFQALKIPIYLKSLCFIYCVFFIILH